MASLPKRRAIALVMAILTSMANVAFARENLENITDHRGDSQNRGLPQMDVRTAGRSTAVDPCVSHHACAHAHAHALMGGQIGRAAVHEKDRSYDTSHDDMPVFDTKWSFSEAPRSAGGPTIMPSLEEDGRLPRGAPDQAYAASPRPLCCTHWKQQSGKSYHHVQLPTAGCGAAPTPASRAVDTSSTSRAATRWRIAVSRAQFRISNSIISTTPFWARTSKPSL